MDVVEFCILTAVLHLFHSLDTLEWLEFDMCRLRCIAFQKSGWRHVFPQQRFSIIQYLKA
jgi:hypothetical protein